MQTESRTALGGIRLPLIAQQAELKSCAGGQASSTVQSTVSLQQLSANSQSSFGEFATVMAGYTAIDMEAGVGTNGSLVGLVTGVQVQKGLDLNVDSAFCSLSQGSPIDLPDPSAIVEATQALLVDRCVVGSWQLTTPIEVGETGPGGSATVAGLEGTTMTIQEDGNVTLNFIGSTPMTIDKNPDDSLAFATATTDLVGIASDSVTANRPDSNLPTGWMSWAATTNLLENLDIIFVSALDGTSFAFWDPVPSPLDPPLLTSGPYTCTATTLSAFVPVGGGPFSFTRVSSLESDDYNKSLDSFDQDMATLRDDLAKADIESKVIALTGEIGNLVFPTFPTYPNTCGSWQSFVVQLNAFGAQLMPLENSAGDLSGQLTEVEASLTDDEKALTASLADVSVAAMKAVQTTAAVLAGDAQAVTAAATDEVQNAQVSMTSLLQDLSSQQSLLDSSRQDANASAPAGCLS